MEKLNYKKYYIMAWIAYIFLIIGTFIFNIAIDVHIAFIISFVIYILIVGIFILMFPNRITEQLNYIKESNVLLEKSYDKIKEFSFNNEKTYITLVLFLLTSYSSILIYNQDTQEKYYIESNYLQSLQSETNKTIELNEIKKHIKLKKQSTNDNKVIKFFENHKNEISNGVIYFIGAVTLLFFISLFLNTYSEYRLVITIIEKEKENKNKEEQKCEKLDLSVNYFLTLIKKYKLENELTSLLCNKNK